MSDSDKRLAVDLACAYISSWNSRPGNNPIDTKEIKAILSQAAAAVEMLSQSE